MPCRQSTQPTLLEWSFPICPAIRSPSPTGLGLTPTQQLLQRAQHKGQRGGVAPHGRQRAQQLQQQPGGAVLFACRKSGS